MSETLQYGRRSQGVICRHDFGTDETLSFETGPSTGSQVRSAL